MKQILNNLDFTKYKGNRSSFSDNIIRYQVVDSTNKELKRLAAAGAPEKTVVLAEEQTGGRGRGGRSWSSPAGKGLWFSLLLMPQKIAPEKAATLTAVTATAIVEGLRSFIAVPAEIKWPNDIYINGRKVAGILAELKTKNSLIENIVLGIGINTNQDPGDFPPEIAPMATSLKIETGNVPNRENLLWQILKSLELSYRLFLDKGFPPFRTLWLAHNNTIGREVAVHCGDSVIRGTALDIDDEGALIIREEKSREIRRIIYGELDIALRSLN